MTFLGYERPDGQAGIRNWVGVISVMDNVNPITRAICGNVNGTIPITTLFVRGQYGRDLKISRSEEHTSELQSLMRISYAVFCLKKKNYKQTITDLNTRRQQRMTKNALTR